MITLERVRKFGFIELASSKILIHYFAYLYIYILVIFGALAGACCIQYSTAQQRCTARASGVVLTARLTKPYGFEY